MIRFTSHARRKLQVFRQLGLNIKERDVLEIVRRPAVLEHTWRDRLVATGPLDSAHALRVVYEKENGNITVVTIYPARRVRYESKLR